MNQFLVLGGQQNPANLFKETLFFNFWPLHSPNKGSTRVKNIFGQTGLGVDQHGPYGTLKPLGPWCGLSVSYWDFMLITKGILLYVLDVCGKHESTICWILPDGSGNLYINVNKCQILCCAFCDEILPATLWDFRILYMLLWLLRILNYFFD